MNIMSGSTPFSLIKGTMKYYSNQPTYLVEEGNRWLLSLALVLSSFGCWFHHNINSTLLRYCSLIQPCLQSRPPCCLPVSVSRKVPDTSGCIWPNDARQFKARQTLFNVTSLTLPPSHRVGHVTPTPLAARSRQQQVHRADKNQMCSQLLSLTPVRIVSQARDYPRFLGYTRRLIKIWRHLWPGLACGADDRIISRASSREGTPLNAPFASTILRTCV